MYTYKCVIKKIIDGDTVDVDIDLGFDVWLRNQRLRIYNIDTPESRTSDPVEKIFGLAAKSRVESLLLIGEQYIITTHISGTKTDLKEKFGRILADFKLPENQKTLSEILISEGFAVKYNGESKEDLRQLHEKNRTRLINEGKVKI
jgi:micrococcal nuclease